jgi:hypothetical protein
MFYSYTVGEYKNILARFFIYQINAPRFLLIFLSKFYCKKETWGYAKVIYKKKEKKS